MPVDFRQVDKHFSVEFSHLQTLTIREDVEYYEGVYEVTPLVDSQSLPTADRYMKNDVTIKAIPIFSTSNTSGGETVYIASEV